jgi:hypothetical protein
MINNKCKGVSHCGQEDLHKKDLKWARDKERYKEHGKGAKEKNYERYGIERENYLSPSLPFFSFFPPFSQSFSPFFSFQILTLSITIEAEKRLYVPKALDFKVFLTRVKVKLIEANPKYFSKKSTRG